MNFAKSGSDSISVQWRIDQWFSELNPEVRLAFKKFQDELLKFNKSVPLIGVKTIPFSDAIHFADSIIASKIVLKDAKGEEIFDFGSGNGFPGLVMALLAPQKKIVLVEMDQRKADFLRHTISLIGVKNTTVMVRPVETLLDLSVKCAISRGFATVSKSILLARRSFVVGGDYYHLKGEEWASEIADIPSQLCSFWQPGLVGEYKLPVGEVKFAVIKTTKIKD